MALIAMTTADSVDYVSDLDPSKTRVKTDKLVDPTDVSKGYVHDTVIKPGATTFKLRGLDVFLMGKIYDDASSLSGVEGSKEFGVHTKVNQTNVQAVRHGLIGFDNYADKAGNQLKFETQREVVNGRPYDVVADKIMNTMGVRLIQELAMQVKNISEVTPSEEKKSDEASPPSA